MAPSPGPGARGHCGCCWARQRLHRPFLAAGGPRRWLLCPAQGQAGAAGQRVPAGGAHTWAGPRPRGSCRALPGWGQAGTGQRGPHCREEDPAFTAQPSQAGSLPPQQPSVPRCRRRKRERGVGVALRGATMSPLTSPAALRRHQNLVPVLPPPGSTGCSAPKAPPGDTAAPAQPFSIPNPLHAPRGALNPQLLQCSDREGTMTHLAAQAPSMSENLSFCFSEYTKNL